MLHVVFGNGRFVAGGDGAEILLSSDGIDWKRQTVATDVISSLTFGNGVFVAGSYSSIFTSADGETWTLRQRLEGEPWPIRLFFANGAFLAVNAVGGVVQSSDGVTWSPWGTLPGYGYGAFIAYGGGKFVAAVSDGNTNRIYSSIDGQVW